ncbi:dienelactone hydrolase family protein [Nocardiopsis sp. EMB25]|uniref:dienelactone hydrolase family protein n=1 Tax=Nocardiopsis sp. EMB25 TaxID=2835867 RepID=UPI00228424EA|nr:dienelactone hydrolase family protein [Nocardiopsis sp. EMB25]MCY9783033.1 dienelactone hydrolase family protein [Nocardiopsis sp. EMB25]
MAEHEVAVETAGVSLNGSLVIPADPVGVVVFAHGSGSSRHSPRNRMVASVLQKAGFATLLFDLLTADEERIDRVTAEQRFDIDLLTGRLSGAVSWLGGREDTRELPVGLFGASTGAAAALRSAADQPTPVGSVVSRGGRPDLAGAALSRVRAPVLLIVGGADHQVLALNEDAARRLGGPHEVHVVPHATHLFEEPGALDRVADAAADWFARTLRAERGAA